LLLGGVALGLWEFSACNVYDQSLLLDAPAGGEAGSAGEESSGGTSERGGRTSGGSTGDAGAEAGGESTGDGGSGNESGVANGGEAPETGGKAASGGSSGGASGEASGGSAEGGQAGGQGGSESGGVGGSSAGSSQGGSSGGSGGAPEGGATAGGATMTCDQAAAGTATELVSVIDDMERNYPAILTNDGRRGFWFSFGDDAGIVPTPGATFEMTQITAGDNPLVPDSEWVAEVSGPVLTDNNVAGMGFDLNANASTKSVYDLTPYGSVHFYYRTVGIEDSELKFVVLQSATTPTDQGGTCSAACNDHFGVVIDPAADWTELTLPLDSSTFVQEGWGAAATWTPAKSLGMQFTVKAGNSAAFEVWVDQIELICGP